MFVATLNWEEIERAASFGAPISFGSDARERLAQALVTYADAASDPRSRFGDPSAVWCDDPLARDAVAALAQEIVQAVGPEAQTTVLSGVAPTAPLPLAEIAERARRLNDIIAAAAQQTAPAVDTVDAAFRRFVCAAAQEFANAGGFASAEPDMNGGEAVFVVFLRALLADASEVLLGLPPDPTIGDPGPALSQRIAAALSAW